MKEIISLIKKAPTRGFTLIEIVVVITILGTLIAGTALTLNPSKQIDKAKDSISQANMQEVRKGLDLYYQDKKCYPAQESAFTTALNTGTEWTEGNTTYMKKVPRDAEEDAFVYLTDNSSTINCRQWYVLFSKLSTEYEDNAVCPLKASACTPEGYDNSWACITGGTTDCEKISGTIVSGEGVITYPTPTPASASATITPTPVDDTQAFVIALPASAKPQLFTGTINPRVPSIGQSVTMRVSTDDYENPIPISSINLTVTSDNQTRVYPMFLYSGTSSNGTWSSTWIQTDTVNHTYMVSIDSRDTSGNTSSIDVSIK